MKRILAVVAAGIIGYGVAKLSDMKQEEVEEYNEDEPEEKLPMFREGDRLHVFNPHTGELFYELGEFDPAMYTVKAVDYDEEDETFRYLIDFYGGAEYVPFNLDLDFEIEDDVDDDIWISEEWLSLPFYPEFARIKSEGGAEAMVNFSEDNDDIEDVEIVDIIDEDLRRREIDRFLDMYRKGNEEERKAAEKELWRVSSKESGE